MLVSTPKPVSSVGKIHFQTKIDQIKKYKKNILLIIKSLFVFLFNNIIHKKVENVIIMNNLI